MGKRGYNEYTLGPKSEETKLKMSLAKKGKPSNVKGKKISEEARARRSAAKRKPYETKRRKQIMEELGMTIEQVLEMEKLIGMKNHRREERRNEERIH